MVQDSEKMSHRIEVLKGQSKCIPRNKIALGKYHMGQRGFSRVITRVNWHLEASVGTKRHSEVIAGVKRHTEQAGKVNTTHETSDGSNYDYQKYRTKINSFNLENKCFQTLKNVNFIFRVQWTAVEKYNFRKHLNYEFTLSLFVTAQDLAQIFISSFDI